MWAVAATGSDAVAERWGGAAAVNRVLHELGGAWAFLAWIAGLPGLFALERAAYRWVARHRGRFAHWGVPPTCERPGTHCTPADSV